MHLACIMQKTNVSSCPRLHLVHLKLEIGLCIFSSVSVSQCVIRLTGVSPPGDTSQPVWQGVRHYNTYFMHTPVQNSPEARTWLPAMIMSIVCTHSALYVLQYRMK